ncbi:protein-L-isoaspartate(D-aspartate) O-methyltransferase [Antarcticirhabdus aurantiaca]|uniref:Protein-L-isoaspartate(D-aspartate) O-methyltransferase n=1 Tax=Antarcticirhabdus aurantiaca TaxID=2606717 RepID=A0ACD4NW82_9HYPH|nr:protein-L-isoaspartate(D-aspartate) O-methyltransferase [Antarcticirhabdus aurantiaca]WAJ31124.1 protein-L-isoaspartate(D-aspartate) O-methyltransferase [Jeongeuplla avenae]
MIGAAREREALAAFLLRLRSGGIADPRLFEALEAVPRRAFLPPDVPDPYVDHAFPIDCGETMPSALKAARLVHLLDLKPHHRVLEIGTGSGYVAALMSRLAVRVVSLDRYKRLLVAAEARLKDAKIANVHLLKEDGRNGYVAGGPYDRIVVHAALQAQPRPFLEQLNAQGMVLCAVGPGDGPQTLLRLQKIGSRFEREEVGTVRYQPIAFGTAAVL